MEPYYAYLRLQANSLKVAETTTDEGIKVEVWITPKNADQFDVIPLVTVVEIPPYAPKHPKFYTRKEMPKQMLRKLISEIQPDSLILEIL